MSSNVIVSDDQYHMLPENQCLALIDNFKPKEGTVWCKIAFDGELCWPPVPAGTTVIKSCGILHRSFPGIDPTNVFFRTCSKDGKWESEKPGTYENPNGWTNYSLCLSPEMDLLIKQLHAGGIDSAKAKISIAKNVRFIEIAGFSMSFMTLLVSCLVFMFFRILRNERTKIHFNLFKAMLLQCSLRLLIFYDQKNLSDNNVSNMTNGIYNTPILCETAYILLEYARSTMFMWMFIEGHYLRSTLTVTIFQGNSPYRTYKLIGWGFPIILTFGWGALMVSHYEPAFCWWGYNSAPYFWILEGPRLGVVVLNFFYLLRIMYILVLKLRPNSTTALLWKALRAAFVLLPLLGIPNLLIILRPPLDGPVWLFGLWAYTIHPLCAFQGFFVAIIYCFTNGEVKTAIRKVYTDRKALRSMELLPTSRRRDRERGSGRVAELSVDVELPRINEVDEPIEPENGSEQVVELQQLQPTCNDVSESQHVIRVHEETS
ncbi:unnamed protein product [Bemisia tabaci]|uniref:PDF receptor n=1 Tax=Bemisia tabaci TaxID=7038 RepID=A0A9P0F3L1_BEMTA|nr:PREDICTED: PDF receptor [Bemisia tabaci]XP_018912493.1 PREDICTED: PDF receptor [Bemisia tabaci]CAH0390536.1 unnamed protein product [Bemisia tabaci]